MENKTEELTIETIEMAGEIADEPILSKNIRELNLGSKSKHRKIIVGPFFCECGMSIDRKNAKRCSHCKRLVCENCCVLYLNEVHCKKCLETEHNIFLTKTDYIILFYIANGVTNAKTIFRLTGVKPDIVEKRIHDFLEKYVTKVSTSLMEKLFPKLRVTDLGRDALGVFDSIFSKDADCVVAKEKLQKFIEDKTKSTYNLRFEGDRICSNQKS